MLLLLPQLPFSMLTVVATEMNCYPSFHPSLPLKIVLFPNTICWGTLWSFPHCDYCCVQWFISFLHTAYRTNVPLTSPSLTESFMGYFTSHFLICTFTVLYKHLKSKEAACVQQCLSPLTSAFSFGSYLAQACILGYRINIHQALTFSAWKNLSCFIN